ncbi:uncharacterized protein LOC130722301 [Lotus japonicus]|uniref:uncharacterized protein LOC130722301 n=1 Tax=Lotus japonicus TaxID=34305 RepID=UPI00258912A7|nr:uncharacterized protein LOC130722301 [Lotus japonicus]
MKYVFAESWASEYLNVILSKWPIKRWIRMMISVIHIVLLLLPRDLVILLNLICSHWRRIFVSCCNRKLEELKEFNEIARFRVYCSSHNQIATINFLLLIG